MKRQYGKVKKILVQRNAAIGDVLLATSVLPVLRKRYPDCGIEFETSCRDVLQNNRYIENIVAPGTSDPSEYDHIFNLNDTYENNPHLSIFEAFARTVLCGADELQLEFDSSDAQKMHAHTLLEQYNLNSQKMVAVQSGASYWIKTMNPEFLGKVMGEIKEKYSISFILLGSLKDPMIQGTIDFRGKCSFLESAAVLQECVAFIGHDSALIHIAKAMRIPVAAFFGHTDPSKRINYTNNDCIFTAPLPCRFCYHKRKPPVIVPFCNLQPLRWQVFDKVLNFGLVFLSKRNNRTVRFIMNRAYSIQDKARNGKRSALCMKSIESQDVASRLVDWFASILSQYKVWNE
jgi:ADP-heptose:LPS heptosyltransferase